MFKLTTHYMTSVNYFLILPKQHEHDTDSLVLTRCTLIPIKKNRKAFGEAMSGVCLINENAVFSTFYTKAWPWLPPYTGLFYLPPTPTQLKTEDVLLPISLVPLHYLCSEINSPRNTGEKNKIEGCGSYTTGSNSSAVSTTCIQKLKVSLKNIQGHLNKVTIIKRNNNYLWLMTFLKCT